MSTGANDATGYWTWAVDYQAYGPVELPEIVRWIKDERILAETWVFTDGSGRWDKACQVPELKMFFRSKSDPAAELTSVFGSLKPASLRRVRVFADMDDHQLAEFLNYMAIAEVPPFETIVRKGDPSDAMYLVLEGELRSCLMVDGKECPLATLPPGSVFGEISFLDHGPHAATVISNVESVLIKVTAAAFDNVIREAPQLAVPFLCGLSKAIAGRVRTLTKRYEDSVHVSHTAPITTPAAA